MLGSLLSSSHEEAASDESVLVPNSSNHLSTALGTRKLLISCAELVSKSDFSSASALLSFLSSNSSPSGDSTQRLVHQFSRALLIRLNSTQLGLGVMSSNYSTRAAHQSSYLTLNQITPFIRFIHLTSNQAILEAVDGERAIHILDFDIMHGVQWPPFMQAIAERCSHTLHPPPTLRITGTGADLDVLHRTGDRLLMFAHSLGLRFQFQPLLVLNDAIPDLHYFHLGSGDEALAVNCALYLHRLKQEDPHQHDIRLFLYKIKALKPKIVTVSEREANHNHPVFLHRFVEALDHYTAIFESLEATLPPNSQERLIVEQIWFGKEIADIVGAEGENRRERHESFESWATMMRSCGFVNVALSPFASSQAKLLLRLHYPSEGYQFQLHHHSCVLGWQTRPLFSVSSWY